MKSSIMALAVASILLAVSYSSAQTGEALPSDLSVLPEGAKPIGNAVIGDGDLKEGMRVSIDIDKDIGWPALALATIYVAAHLVIALSGLVCLVILWGSVILCAMNAGNRQLMHLVQLVGGITINGDISTLGRIYVTGAGLLGTMLILMFCALALVTLHISIS